MKLMLRTLLPILLLFVVSRGARGASPSALAISGCNAIASQQTIGCADYEYHHVTTIEGSPFCVVGFHNVRAGTQQSFVEEVWYPQSSYDCDWLSAIGQCMPQCVWPGQGGGCNPATDPTGCDGSPVMVSFQGNDFELTNPEGGVRFDVDADGVAEQTAWTSQGSLVGILVRGAHPASGADLFGNHTIPGIADGFSALAWFDNGDGRIDATDPIWPQLGLWFDGANGSPRDGVAQPGEIIPISQLLASISLRDRTTGRRDRWGNLYRQVGHATTLDGHRVPAVDVWLLHD